MIRPAPLFAISLVLLASVAPSSAHATGFTDIGQDLRLHVQPTVDVHGALRTRGELLYNLDLDRGLSPAGDPLFPVPLSDPGGQLLTHADMRLRTDLAFYAPGQGLAVKVRIDALDNLVLGSMPDGVPSVAVGQRPPEDAIRIKRAYGEVLTPVGVFVAGRTGSQFGLGMLTNGGDCADCDSGDAADRVALITPVLGHIWAFAFDLTATGPFVPRDTGRAVDLDPHDNVRNFTFAMLRWRDDQARVRRSRAGKTTVEYGAYIAHRWQDRDVPAHYLPIARPVPLTAAQSMDRGFRATAVDGWLRVTLPFGRVELEAALLRGRIGQPSLIPGALLRDEITSTQLGAALESDFGPRDGWLGAGLDLGYASGDPAPGFGAFPGPTDPAAAPGDLDAPQASPPFDTRVDNFRFHPDYRIDRILFREIVGTVTDAVYVRPHARVRIVEIGPGTLSASVALVASFLAEPTSAPACDGSRPSCSDRALGLEIDPTLVYETRDGLLFAVEHAVLFPFAALDNPAAGLSARPAQLLRFRAGFVY